MKSVQTKYYKHNYMTNMYAKKFSDSNFNQAVNGKISFFQEIAPISHIHKNCNIIFKV